MCLMTTIVGIRAEAAISGHILAGCQLSIVIISNIRVGGKETAAATDAREIYLHLITLAAHTHPAKAAGSV